MKHEKASKVSVGYSKGHVASHCGNCKSFQPKTDTCKKVEGTIDSMMWCKLWEHK